MSDTKTLASDTASTLFLSPDVTPTVVAFGTTGAGKSSVINMLSDDLAYPPQQAKVDFSAAGVTDTVKAYHKEVHGRPFTILDTMGTGEIEGGTVPTHLAIERLYDHLINSQTGIHLVMLVMKAGRMTSLDECNYLLARYLFGDEVPIVLVLTNLENADSKDTWWEGQDNKGRLALLKNVGLVSFLGPKDVFKPVYDQSKGDLALFLATHLRGGPGFKLQPKPRIDGLVTALLHLIRTQKQAALFHSAMLDLLRNYDIATKHAQPLADKIRLTAPLPVVVFVGAPGSGKSTIIGLLRDDESGPTQPTGLSNSVTGGIQDYTKVINGQRVRILETPGVPSNSDSIPTEKAIRTLYDSVVAHPLGIRCFVVVAKVGQDGMALTDTTHYRLVRRLADDHAPICLITVGPGDHKSKIRKDGLSLQKHVALPTLDRSPIAAQHQVQSLRDSVEVALAAFIKSTTDYTVSLNPDFPSLLAMVSVPVTPRKPNSDTKSTVSDSQLDSGKNQVRSLTAPRSFEVLPQSEPIGHDKPEKPAKNIILFGDTGSGKSSIINMLSVGLPHDVRRAKVSGDAAGETFENEEYHKFLPRNSPDPEFFKVHDTAGINEATDGKVIAMQAIENLWRLLGWLNDDGVHLLVLVIRGARYSSSSTKNYRLLKALTEDQIPIALVVTGMENESNPDDWWRKSRKRFDEEQVRFAGTPACITATRGRVVREGTDECVYDAAYSASIPKVERLFLDTPTSVPYRQERKTLFEKRSADICSFFDVKAPGFKEELYTLLLGYGIHEKEAKGFANKATTKRRFTQS